MKFAKSLLLPGLLLLLIPFGMAQGRMRGGPPRDWQVPDDAPPIVKRAFNAGARLKYSGTRLVEFKRGPDRVQFTEYVFRDGTKTKTEFPNDSPYAGQIIVENGDKRYHYYPDTNEIHVGRARRQFAFRSLAMASRRISKGGLKFATKAGADVAGRSTTLATISDDKGNQIQRLWIDSETALLLKREMLDPVGAIVGSYEFKQINYHPRFDRNEFTITRVGAIIVSPLDLAKRTASDNDMQPVFLPDSSGFEIESARMMSLGGVRVFAQFYRNGDKVVSLFQFAADAAQPRGRRSEDFTSYSWRMNARTFSLVGRMSEDELKSLARLLGDR